MKMELFPKFLMRIIGEHFRRYAHALRFAIGLHATNVTLYYVSHLSFTPNLKLKKYLKFIF